MKFKFFVRTVILVLFVGGFLKFIVFGDIGIKKYFQVKKEIEFEKNKIEKLETKIKKLTSKIENWQKSDFKIEKMAREKLQMGFDNEKVYIFQK